MDGFGEHTSSDGETYKGNFKNGQKHGFGVSTFKNGSVYEGQFAENKPQGEGKLSLQNGAIYKGLFKDGKIEGSGVCESRGEKISCTDLLKRDFFKTQIRKN